MIGHKTMRESPRPNNRMEPSGPNRYLSSDSDIRKHMQLDRKIVSSMIVDSVLSVLRNDYQFNDEAIDLFHAKLKKEIESR